MSDAAADLTSIRALFNEKEKELSMAAAQVEELTRQLEQFGNGQVHHAQAHPDSKAYFVQLHLERLRAELMVRRRKKIDRKEKLIDHTRICGFLHLSWFLPFETNGSFFFPLFSLSLS